MENPKKKTPKGKKENQPKKEGLVSESKVIVLKGQPDILERRLALEKLYDPCLIKIKEVRLITSFRKLKKMISRNSGVIMIESSVLTDWVLARAIKKPCVSISQRIEIRKPQREPYKDPEGKTNHSIKYGNPLREIYFK